jgi:two-component system chemotaxis response regulator CheB
MGASDYVTKPSSAAGKAVAQERIRDDLVPKIRSLCRVGASATVTMAPVPRERQTQPTSPVVRPPIRPDQRAGAIAMGLSTGGPNALGAILSALPAGFPAPIVVVQHMPNVFTRLLADRLNGQTPLTVVEAEDGQVIRPGTVYIAPGDFHLRLHRLGVEVVAALDQEPPLNSHRPAADVLFRSVAEVYGARALGLILTGIGEDGLRGCEDITRAGGRILVQDEATSLVWEMPGHVARAGLADAVLPLGDVAEELMRRTGGSPSAGVPVRLGIGA